MIIRSSDKVLVQGITGKQGTFWTERMQEYGTNVVAGVNPKKAGTIHCGVPVTASAVEAMEQVGFDYSVLFIPPMLVKGAALDAIEAGAKGVCILTEHIPVRDVMYIMSAAKERGVQILGPNTAGCVTPDEGFLGFMPAFNRKIGEFSEIETTPDGDILTSDEWEARKDEFLPNTSDMDYITSLMKPVYGIGEYANWIAAPKVGIDNKPGDFEYVRLDQS